MSSQANYKSILSLVADRSNLNEAKFAESHCNSDWVLSLYSSLISYRATHHCFIYFFNVPVLYKGKTWNVFASLASYVSSQFYNSYIQESWVIDKYHASGTIWLDSNVHQIWKFPHWRYSPIVCLGWFNCSLWSDSLHAELSLVVAKVMTVIESLLSYVASELEFLASINIYHSDPMTVEPALLSNERWEQGFWVTLANCGQFWESLVEMWFLQLPPLGPGLHQPDYPTVCLHGKRPASDTAQLCEWERSQAATGMPYILYMAF